MARTLLDAAAASTQARAASYGHGHASSIGHGHGVVSAALQPAAPSAPVALRVTVVATVDEHAEHPVALALRVHPENTTLRPSFFPPRRGERLPQYGLPSTPAQRLAMLRGRIDEPAAARALKILGR